MAKSSELMKIVAVSLVLLFLISGFSVVYAKASSSSTKDQEFKSSNLALDTLSQDTTSKPTNYTFFTILTSYWLKLAKINAGSNTTIYMGFASNTTNLLNGVTVGEAPQLSNIYGEYDNGKNVFLYYTNFTNLNGWSVNVSKGSYSINNGLIINFNGPGYVVTNSTYGPGTAFVAGITSIGDVDDVGYFNISEPINGGQGWAGAFIRLACGNTYPDQWNGSGEANGCGNAYGYFINKEGVPGTYMVEILNNTTSIQFLNGNFSRQINKDYPQYPAHVGFDGAYTSISVQWAFVMNAPPNGVMPSFNVSKQVYPSNSSQNIKVPADIIYYVPIRIINNQSIPTPNDYQQLILINSSAYQKYESPNLSNVEFFYPNGTIIPSWLEGNNENTAGIIANLTIRVTPAYLSSVIVNGQYMQLNSSGYLELKDLKPGTYYILAENPYYRWYFNEYMVTGGANYINISLTPASEYRGEGEQYPWVQIGPAFVSNPFDQNNMIYFNASGHIGLIQIDPFNPNVIYVASGTAEDGLMGPIGDGGVYMTNDDGKNWIPMDFGLPYGPISGLYMDPNNPNILLVSFTNNGIYRTDDGGLWWYQVSNITGVNSFQQSGQIIFAGSNVGIIESDDDGLTWTIVYSSQYFTGPISVSGNTIYALVFGPGVPGSVMAYIYMIRSNDLGKSWETLHTFIGNYPVFISASPFNSSEVYFSYAGDKYTLYSGDGGINIINTSLEPVKDVVFDPKNESIVWAYGAGAFYYSFNGGKCFKEGMPAVDMMGLAVYDGNGSMIVLGSDQGLYQSNDCGLTWKSINGDLSDTLTYSVGVGGNGSIIAVGMQDYSAFLSVDGGKSWFGGNTQPIPIGGEGTDIAINPSNASWLYAYSMSGGLSVSNNSGLEFQNVVSGSTIPYLISPNALFIDPYNDSDVFFAYVNGIYNGTEYGKIWDIWRNSPTNATTISMPERNIFLVGTTDGIYYNINGTWSKSTGISGYVSSIAVDPANRSVVVAATGMFSLGTLYISHDYGKSFVFLNKSMGNSSVGGLFGIPVEVYWLNISNYPLVAATVDRGVLISLDQGENWVPINYNLRSGEITSVWFNDHDLYISTYGEGILVYPNFSIYNLSGTINGYTNIDNLNLTINGQPVDIYEGHFRVFLKPGNYTISYLVNGVTKSMIVDVKPMSTLTLYLNASSIRNYTIGFTESGLPAGAKWFVNLSNGQTFSSTTSTIVFNEPNGSYTYSISSSNKEYAPLSPKGSFTVNGSNLNISVSFKLVVYEITFTESGLPSGTLWFITLNGITHNSTTNTITFTEPNGSYSYTIKTPISGGTGIQYVVLQSKGTLTVNGANININVPYRTQYYLTMIASPSNGGTVSPSSGWYNVGSSVTIDAISNSNFEFVSWSGTGNGSYSGTNNPVSITINGPITETANFIELYKIKFIETGLPSETTWYVNLSNGQSYSGTGTTITFSEPNGTYSYTIATVNKNYSPSQSSGTLTVNGSNVNIGITFNLVTYTITFTENGLPSGTSWSVTLNNITKTSTNATITISEPNGSYSYIISSISGYRANAYSGTINVNGNQVVINITWTIITYPITITENGIPNGTSWSATLTGTTFNGQSINVTLSSRNNTITFYEPNGTYAYTIHLPSGYQGSNTKGSINLSGNSATLTIKAQGTMNYLWILIIAAVIIIALTIGIILLRKGKNKQGVKEWKGPPKQN